MRGFSVSLFVLIVAAAVGAQSKSVTGAEIDDLLAKAKAARKVLPYRVTKSVFIASGFEREPKLRSSNVTDYEPPDRFLVVVEKKEGDETVRSETLWIAGVKYVKNLQGRWSKALANTARIEGDGLLGQEALSVKIKHKYLGKETLNDRRTDLYEATTAKKYATGIMQLVHKRVIRYWFSEQGLLVKQTAEERLENFDRVVHRSVDEYDYDHPGKVPALDTQL